MPNPDLANYVDLTINDRDAQAVFEAAILQMKTDLPEWTPREGNVEVVLLEAMALQVAESIFAINRLPNGVIEALLKFFGIERDSGAAPTTTMRFYMAGVMGYSVPAGTKVTVIPSGGASSMTFTTDYELVIPPGQNQGIVPATGTELSARVNGIPQGALCELQDSVIYVDYVRLETDIANGRDPESDLDYLERGVTRFSRLSDTLVVPNDFLVAAMEYPFVKRAKPIDLYDASNDPDGNGPVGVDPGHITMALYGDESMLTTEQKAQVQAEFEEMMQANLVLHIIDPVVTQIDIDVVVGYLPTYEQADVINSVIQRMIEYLDPLGWAWDTQIRYNELIQEISNVPGVDYVDSLSSPTGNFQLPGIAGLPRPGVINVTANLV